VLELHPFRGAVVVADRAKRVVAPPYDALAPTVRAALAATDPDSYLGALPPGTGADAAALDAALGRCRTHLDRLLADGHYRPLPGPAVGVLTLGAGPERAVAVIGDVPVGAFAPLVEDGPAGPFTPGDGLVRPHERVQEARVAELARYLEVVGVASSPVALTQAPDARVQALTDRVTAGVPDVAYHADDGVDVALWCVTDRELQDALCAAVAGAGEAALVDGHHRGAAAARYAARVEAGPGDPAGRVLCAILPHDHLSVRAFHRRLDDVLVPGADGEDLGPVLERLAAAGVGVGPLDGPRRPGRPRHVSLTAAGGWWELDLRALARHGDPVEALDVRTVERDLVPLLLGADRSSPPTPVADPLGLDALVAPGAIGLALHPPPFDTVLAIAAAGGVLPAKTTYVTPKLRSGLLVTPRPHPTAPGA
jgi:uncharacterized protein (DUF1015 family)